MKNLMILTICFCLLMGVAGVALPEAGEIIKQRREVKGFDRVRLSGKGVLIITQGGDESLTVEAEKNIMEYVITKVEDGCLYLGLDGGFLNDLTSAWPVIYNLKLKSINKLQVSGSSRVLCDKLTLPDLELKASGESKVTLDEVAINKLDLKLSGSSNVTLKGELQRQEIGISGASRYDARQARSKEVRGRVTGFSEVNLWVEDDLDIRASGKSRIFYQGAPELKCKTTGAASVQPI